MPSNRGQLRQREKQKRRRADVKKKQSAFQTALRPAALLRRASDFPIQEAWLSTSWRDVDEDMPGLVTAIILRRSPAGILLGTALIDRTCLGIRDADAAVMPALEADSYVRQVRDSVDLEKVDPQTCLSVVHHALAYAQSLGFSPHPDFNLSLFQPMPEPLIDTPLAKPSKPLYVAGPNDDLLDIFAKLCAATGDNFRYLIPDAEGGGHPTEARDALRELEGLRATIAAETLIREGKIEEAEAICEDLSNNPKLQFDVAELKARLCEARGDVPGAIGWMKKAMQIRESNPNDSDDVREPLRRLLLESSRSDTQELDDDLVSHDDEMDERRSRV